MENGSRDRPLRWSVRPAVSLGGADEGPASFYEVSAGQVAADRAGNLHVLDGSAGRVAVFDSAGRSLRTLGRKGGGPGELAVLRPADTLRLATSRLPEAKEIRFESCPMRFRGLPPLFHPSLRWAARGVRIVVASTSPYALDIFEGDARVASVRRDVPPRPVTEEMAVADHVVIHRIEEEG